MFIENSDKGNMFQPNIDQLHRYNLYKMISVSLDCRAISTDSGSSLTSVDRNYFIDSLKIMENIYMKSIDSIDNDMNYIYQYLGNVVQKIIDHIVKSLDKPVIQGLVEILSEEFITHLSLLERYSFDILIRYPTKENWISIMRKIGVIP